MPNVRARKSRRKARINTTQYARKNKRKQRKKAQIPLECIRERWDHKKSVRQNLAALGLATDPNVAVPLRKKKQEEFGDIDEYRKTQPMEQESATASSSEAVKEMEEVASHAAHRGSHMSRSEALFLVKLIQDHGTDYKTMSFDKRNYNQLTENQLRRKCNQLRQSHHAVLLDPPDETQTTAST